jgi:hypothetical protein
MFPSLDEFLQTQNSQTNLPPADPARIRASLPAAPPRPQRNLLTAGIAAGVDELQGMGGAALGAIGRAVNNESLTRYGEQISERNKAEAAIAGRPDLEIAPWKEGGAGFLPWAGYQLAKQIPMTAGAILAGAAASAAGPATAATAGGAALARLGMAVPGFLGGGRGVAAVASQRAIAAGATESAAALAGQKAAQTAGLEFSKKALGATAFGAPLGAGSMYQEAVERGEPTQGDAIKALALSPVYGALEAFEVAPLTGIFARGLTGGIARRAVTGAAQSAVTEPFTEAAQTGLENSFRSDLTMAQKAERILDAAATGLVVGAGFGAGVGAISPAVKADPATATNDDLKDQIDAPLKPAASLQDKYAQFDMPAIIDRMARAEQRVAAGENTSAMERDFRMYRAEVMRRLSEMDDATVAQTRNTLAAQVQAGDQSPTVRNSLNVFDAELGNRIRRQDESLAQAPEVRTAPVVSAEGGLFSEADLAQPDLVGGEIPTATAAQQPAAKVQAATEYQKRLSSLVGGDVGTKTGFGKWVQETAPTTDAELVDAILTRTEEKPGKSLGKRFTTLVDRVANPIAMQAELNTAQQSLIDTEIAVNNNRATPQALEAAQNQVADVQSRIATYQAVVQERASRPPPAPAAPQGAPSGQVSPPASQAEPTTNLAQTGFDFETPTRESVTAGSIKPGDVIARGSRTFPVTRVEPLETGGLAITAGEGRTQFTTRVMGTDPVTRVVTEVRAAPAVEPELAPVVGRERITQETPREAVPVSQIAVGDRIIRGQRALPVTNVSTDAAGRVTITAQVNKKKKQTMRMEPGADVTVVSTQEVLDRKAAQQGAQQTSPSGANAAATATNLANDWDRQNKGQQRVDSWFDGYAETIRTFDAVGAQGKTVPSHGMAKSPTLGQALKDLIELVSGNGNSNLYTAPLATPAGTGTATGTATGTSYRDGPFIITFREGSTDTAQENITGILVNPANAELVAPLQEMFPNLTVRSYSDVADVISASKIEAQQAAQEAAVANIDRPSPPPPTPPNEPSISTEETQDVRSAVNQSDSALKLSQNFIQRVPVNTKGAALELFKTLLGWMSLRHLTESYDSKKLFSGTLKAYDTAVNMPASIKKLFARIHSGSIADIERLANTNKEAAKKLYRLMSMPGIKIGATWDEQPWLHGEKDAAQLKKMVGEANDIIRWMKQNWADPRTKDKKVYDIYQEAVDGNEMNNYARLASMFYVFAMNDEKLNNIYRFGPDPMNRFLSRETDFQDSPAKAKEYWKGVLNTQLNAAKTFAEGKKGLDNLNQRIKQIEAALESMDRSTYFHLGRFGNFGVSFSIKKKDGDLDIASLNKLRAAMEQEKLDGFEFMEGSDKTKVFLRFETVEQRDAMVRIAESLMGQGDIEPKSLRVNTRKDGGEAFTGDKVSANKLIAQMSNSIDAQIARLDSDADAAAIKALKKFKEQATNNLNMAALELSPENAIARVLARRKEVSGFSKNAFRSLAYRYQVNADALANMTAAPYISQALVGIENRVREAGQSGDAPIDLSNLAKMEAIRDEIMLRSGDSLNLIDRNLLDSLRAFSFAFFMSSASSALLQQGSIPVIVWPEFGKKHGFVKAAKALGKAAPQAFKIMNAIVSMDLKRGATRGPDIVLTPQALQKAGVDPATAKFILKLANATAIDIGSAAREQGRVVEGTQDTGGDKALRWLGFMNSYSETFSRVLTGLAARNLSTNDTTGLDYATEVITETLFRYDAVNQSRQVGPSGIVGKYSPVALQFNNFGFFTMEKLYREMLKTMSKNATPEEKAQARKFMGGFLATQMLMAGALGLPFATVLARVVEAMAETLGDDEEPFDAKTALKNYLNESFGANIGEIAASGIFRAADINIQSRVGLQDLAPFSRFLADRRNFQDKFDDLVKDSAGAPIGAIFNALNGAVEVYKGNYIEGFKMGLPGVFKNMVTAYEMSDRGYVDKQGNVLPMSADANDILAAVLGFQSAEMGRYTEGRMTNLTREGLLSRRAGDLRRKAAIAFEKGDTEAFNEVVDQIVRFDQANPTRKIAPTLARIIEQRARARAQAEATGTTIGTSLRDIEGMQAQEYVFPRQ